ncbi:MAG TPA: hypothetical protein PLL96_10385 [Syntrophorhabdaceae bacterium]|nr:hypothetical protein [Syntrophorhabdaceae bacterium]HRR72728.1 hypothetical protein [Syntrophorhabdaceae bacterium]HRV23497.1 hypothetical protein [Syntrophorhabdaceae bacterium]
MIVNTFIITPKKEYTETLMATSEHQKSILAALLPEKYRDLFKSIVKDSVNEIMDNRDYKKAYRIMAEAMLTGNGSLWYPDNRSDSLQQVLRKTFYETLLIIKNDYNPYKFDQFIVVFSSEVITEKQYESICYPKKHNNKKAGGQILMCDFLRTTNHIPLRR